jgi:hypothetical protein
MRVGKGTPVLTVVTDAEPTRAGAAGEVSRPPRSAAADRQDRAEGAQWMLAAALEAETAAYRGAAAAVPHGLSSKGFVPAR